MWVSGSSPFCLPASDLIDAPSSPRRGALDQDRVDGSPGTSSWGWSHGSERVGKLAQATGIAYPAEPGLRWPQQLARVAWDELCLISAPIRGSPIEHDQRLAAAHVAGSSEQGTPGDAGHRYPPHLDEIGQFSRHGATREVSRDLSVADGVHRWGDEAASVGHLQWDGDLPAPGR